MTNIGLRPILVGGCVRDFFLNIPCKDYDIEVYNTNSLNDLESQLEKYGKVAITGKNFGVLKLSCNEFDFDFALPRTEKKTTTGHNGFEVFTDGFLDFNEASLRRDFTINAMGYDFKTEKILDPFDAKNDLDNKILRHIKDETFVEDPLRVYRAVQLCARFNLSLDKKTVTFCKQMVENNELEELPKERVFEEFKKLLLKSEKPSIGFKLIKDLNIIKHFPQLNSLVGCLQDEEYHPEGDVWVHTLMCIDEMVKLKTGDEYKDLYLMFAILCHDFGKPMTSEIRNGRITSYNHEKMGIEPTEAFLKLLTNEKKLIEKIIPLVQHHLSPFQLYFHNSSLKAIKRLATKVNIEELCIVALADCRGRDIKDKEKCQNAVDWLLNNAQQLNVHNEKLEPIVQGRDLINLGLEPSKIYKEILEYAYDMQIENETLSKNDILISIQKKYNEIF